MEKAKQKRDPVNRDIEMFLAGAGSLEIWEEYGWKQYAQYAEDLRLFDLGFEFKDLGIGQRRAQSRRQLLRPAEGLGYQIADRWDIQDVTATPPGAIALLKLNGVMRMDGGLSSPGVSSLVADLRNAYANPNVIGVVLETNSGGGESMAGTVLKSAISERNMPVIGFAHLAASAAYRALSGADEIIASSDAAEFGSIGTMITIDQKMLAKYRKRYTDFYGADAPGKNADYRQAIDKDFTGLQKRVDEKTTAFQAEIQRDRPLRGTPETVRETLDGSVYDALQGKARGLVDMIGNMQTAVRRVQALQGKYEKLNKRVA